MGRCPTSAERATGCQLRRSAGSVLESSAIPISPPFPDGSHTPPRTEHRARRRRPDRVHGCAVVSARSDKQAVRMGAPKGCFDDSRAVLLTTRCGRDRRRPRHRRRQRHRPRRGGSRRRHLRPHRGGPRRCGRRGRSARSARRGGRRRPLDFEVVASLARRAKERFGRLDVVVNNLGGTMPLPLLDTTPEYLEEAFHFNVAPPMRWCARPCRCSSRRRRVDRQHSSVMGGSPPGLPRIRHGQGGPRPLHRLAAKDLARASGSTPSPSARPPPRPSTSSCRATSCASRWRRPPPSGASATSRTSQPACSSGVGRRRVPDREGPGNRRGHRRPDPGIRPADL